MSYPDTPMVYVVSGLPRSGTSMMMRMLHAGGMPLLTDDARPADDDNPRGYFEFERAKRLKQDAEWLPLAAGKAVKVISFLLPALPQEYTYRVIFMERPIEQVLASQRVMLERQGRVEEARTAEVEAAFGKHLSHIRGWLRDQGNFELLELSYPDVICDPAGTVATVAQFVGKPLDLVAMAAAVDPSLWRQHG